MVVGSLLVTPGGIGLIQRVGDVKSLEYMATSVGPVKVSTLESTFISEIDHLRWVSAMNPGDSAKSLDGRSF